MAGSKLLRPLGLRMAQDRVQTQYRFIQAALRGRRKPRVALVVGLLPMGGNAACPLQVIYSGTHREAKLAQSSCTTR